MSCGAFSDCGLICKFEEADISELLGAGWKPPEVFVAKGRDGKTDIWGIICRPKTSIRNKNILWSNRFMPGRKDLMCRNHFGGARRFFVVDGFGICRCANGRDGNGEQIKNVSRCLLEESKRRWLPDRILWHKAAAARYSWYDISRVGIYGTSAGGQNAAAAVLFHPEFYKAAVANSGCHDNRMDKASWNEQWMGYPVGRNMLNVPISRTPAS